MPRPNQRRRQRHTRANGGKQPAFAGKNDRRKTGHHLGAPASRRQVARIAKHAGETPARPETACSSPITARSPVFHNTCEPVPNNYPEPDRGRAERGWRYFPAGTVLLATRREPGSWARESGSAPRRLAAFGRAHGNRPAIQRTAHAPSRVDCASLADPKPAPPHAIGLTNSHNYFP